MKHFLFFVICAIGSLNIAASNPMTESGSSANSGSAEYREFSVKDLMFSYVDSISTNAPTLIKHYGKKHKVSSLLGSKLELYTVELINMYSQEINSYIVLLLNNQSCLLTGMDIVAISKALTKMQTYMREFPQLYEEGMAFNYPINSKLLSFSLKRKKGKMTWEGLVSLHDNGHTSYCVFSDIQEILDQLLLHFNSCLKEVEERINNPKDRKFVTLYDASSESNIYCYDYGESTKKILNYNFDENLNCEYSNELYKQKFDKKLYKRLYSVANRELTGLDKTKRFGDLEAYINRRGEIIHVNLMLYTKYTEKISQKTILKMLDILGRYELFPFPANFSKDVDIVRVFVPLFKCEEDIE